MQKLLILAIVLGLATGANAVSPIRTGAADDFSFNFVGGISRTTALNNDGTMSSELFDVESEKPALLNICNVTIFCQRDCIDAFDWNNLLLSGMMVKSLPLPGQLKVRDSDAYYFP